MMRVQGKHAFSTLAAALAVMALGAPGCSDPAPATPRVTLDTELRVGTNTSQTCPQTGPLFTIGSFGNPVASPPEPVTPVEDGQSHQQGKAQVVCAVVASGNGAFDVKASAQLTGATGGLFRIEGSFRPEGEQTGVRVTLSKQPFGVFEAKDCKVRYEGDFQGVAAGRVWGTLDCADASRQDTGSACQALAQFKFENCAQ
jgi:hypothetical protein